MRVEIEVEADGDPEQVRLLVTNTLDMLMGALVDDEAVLDPSISVAFGCPEPVEWVV